MKVQLFSLTTSLVCAKDEILEFQRIRLLPRSLLFDEFVLLSALLHFCRWFEENLGSKFVF